MVHQTSLWSFIFFANFFDFFDFVERVLELEMAELAELCELVGLCESETGRRVGIAGCECEKTEASP